MILLHCYIPAGASTSDINMDILEGDGWEVDETLIITLGEPQDAELGSPAVQTIVITESSEEPSVSFASSGQSISKEILFSSGSSISNAWSDPVVIPILVSGTAQAGSGMIIP